MHFFECILRLVDDSPLSLTSQILDKLLDRESQTHKPQTLSSFYSSKPAANSQRSPSKHAAHTAHGHGGATGGVSKHAPNATAAAGSSSVQVVAAGGAAGQLAGSGVQNNATPGEGVSEAREQGETQTGWLCRTVPVLH